MHKWSGADKFPACITIFSAPNYCDFYNNKGAVIKFDVRNFLKLEQYFEYSAIRWKSPSLFTAKFYGSFQLVDSFCQWKNNLDSLWIIEA